MQEIPIAGPPKGCFIRELRSRKLTLCPRCSEDVRWRHAVWELGNAEVGTGDEERLETMVLEGRWETARRDFQAAGRPVDLRVWQALRCPDGRVSVVRSLLPVELWEDDAYERVFTLTDTERREIERLAAGQWVRR